MSAEDGPDADRSEPEPGRLEGYMCRFLSSVDHWMTKFEAEGLDEERIPA